ncbi:hypothetical protein M405DRAFT_840668 [Rhizopogon salebrosus TDB-379]|nr:hypothetical protein M405DRAFT_840668 [Rhizopogon salebrosus TDB-379]
MASHDSELVTQFTEDAFANEDRICQRPSCASKIRKGEPCFYIATIIHGQPGRFVCGACHQRYQGKAATGVRPTGTVGRPLPDPQHIRQSVNAGQRSDCGQYEVVETVVVEVLVSTVRDSGDHATGWRRTVWGCAWEAGRTWRVLERRLGQREFWEDCGRV